MKTHANLVLTRVVLGLGLCLSIMGCNVQNIAIQNGELPSGDLALVTPFLGTYAYSDQATPQGLMTLSLEGNRLVLTSSSDVVGPNCDSKIGELQTVSYGTDSQGATQYAEADFALDPGQCTKITGRTLHFNYTHTLTSEREIYSTMVLIDTTPDGAGSGTAQYVANTRTLYKK